MKLRQRTISLIKSFLTAIALTVSFACPISKGQCADGIEFVTTRIYELLCEYSFVAVLIFALALVFYSYTCKIREQGKTNYYGLSFFFAACLLIGTSYAETNSAVFLVGSISNLILSALSLLGHAFLFNDLIYYLWLGIKRISDSNWSNKMTDFLFDEKHTFRNCFFAIYVCWLPAILLSFPGNLCYDVLGEISQAMGETPLTSHHPILHILLIGFFVKLGELIGSYSVGLFLYILFQSTMLALALSTTIFWLKKEKAISNLGLILILGIYMLSPMYSNMASTAIKDIPFMAMVIWYLVLMAEIYFHKEKLNDIKTVCFFILLQVMVCLLRNNGLYMVAISDIVILIVWCRKKGVKEKIRLALLLLLIPIALAKIINSGLIVMTGAEKGSSAEALSLPFQQTARYLQLYQNEITDDEKVAIERLLGPVNELAAAYDPDIADPVKSCVYNKGQDTSQAKIEYIKTWVKMFFKHPGVYFEAFFAHVYGWFDPAITNAPRYEVEDSIFGSGLTTPQKLVLFWYRFVDRFTPLSILQNVGFYTWMMFILAKFLKENNPKNLHLMTPLLVSLLICMAAPCFYLHPRYAYPYMFSLPFYYGISLKKTED